MKLKCHQGIVREMPVPGLIRDVRVFSNTRCSNQLELIGPQTMQQRIWTVSEAKARLPEILRKASEEGPQRIGPSKYIE